jgi:DNA-binding MarR family transcriptional regulator
MQEWNFVTTHAQALLFLARQPSVTAGEVASAMGITRSRVRGIMADLCTEGYVSKSRDGRELRYQIVPDLRLSEDRRREVAVCDFLESIFRRKRYG